MAWRGLLAVAVLGAACNYRVAFEDYCTDTGFCRCTDGNCCVVEQFRCDQFECCDGLSCEDGICLSAANLVAQPPFVDFGKVNANAPARTHVVIENVGSAATPSAPELTVSEGFALEETDCDHVLAPGERCTVTVGCRADPFALSVDGELTLQYGRRTLEVGLTAQTGVELTIVASGAARVHEPLKGRSCPIGDTEPGWHIHCRWVAPLGSQMFLQLGPIADGYTIMSSALCTWADGTCTVTADAPKRIEAYVDPYLDIAVIGAGTIQGVTPACVGASEDVTYCSYPVTGPVTLTAVPTPPATRVEWRAACTGSAEGECVVDVRGQTYVHATFL